MTRWTLRFKPARRVQWWIRNRWPVPDDLDQATRTQIVIGVRKSNVAQWVWIFFLTIALGYAIVQLHTQQLRLHSQTVNAAHNATVSCQRSRLIGPYLARDYEHRHALPPNIMRLYVNTIPRSC